MPNVPRDGLYVALEGIDGSGKSSLMGSLAEGLERLGLEVVRVAEPRGTQLGARLAAIGFEYINDLDDFVHSMILLAARADLHARVVRPALERRAVVLSDRTFYSMLAYQIYYKDPKQAALRNHANVLHRDACLARRVATHSVRCPDQVLILDIPSTLALERDHSPPPTPAGYSDAEYLGKVRRAYLELAHTGRHMRVVDAARDPAAVAADAARIIAEAVQSGKHRIARR